MPRAGHQRLAWLKHAFAVDPPGPAQPNEAQARIVERVCREVVSRRLTTPAMMALEMGRPAQLSLGAGPHVLSAVRGIVRRRERIRAVHRVSGAARLARLHRRPHRGARGRERRRDDREPIPQNARVILATDCGSTTTKAILIEKVDGVYRQTYRGEAPTTVEEPVADVTIGVVNAVTEVQELAGRRLVDDDGRIIRPATEQRRLRHLHLDVERRRRPADDGGRRRPRDDGRERQARGARRRRDRDGRHRVERQAQPHEQIQRIRELRPDMILISGGTDGGTTTHVVQIAELIAPAKPRPRFGGEYQTADHLRRQQGRRAARREGAGRDGFALTVVDNLRPVLERENLGPARDAIHDLFLEHVMAHAPGYDKLMRGPTRRSCRRRARSATSCRRSPSGRASTSSASTSAARRPTSSACSTARFNRTVSANLGMSYSISNVCAEAGMPNILRWVPFEMDERELRNRVKNKMIRPTTIPQTLEALMFEQAVAREALRLAYIQHKEFATTLKGVQQQRTVGDAFSQETAGQTIVDNMKLDLLVGSGGVLSHAPRMQQTAMMLIDAFEPEGLHRRWPRTRSS